MPERPIALVTGASRGIGAAVARSLADTHDLLLGGRDTTALEKVTADIPGARPWPVELTDHESVAAAVAEIDRLDVLVHSAGLVELAPVADAPPDSWRRTFELNLFAVTELTRLLLPALRAAKGHVVLVNSGAGLSAKPNWGSYAASKFALRAFADVLRAEEAASGVRVTSVFPGRTATEMQRGVRAAEGGEFEPENYLRPESVAEPIVSAVRSSRDAHMTELVIRPA
ncbi:NADP-dependent 3-hydroxy acid dehydrogenase YdfG [Saccharopolyspora erythraea NRRL 2338]|uniref:Short-chain dehydrogenase/reductase SDR n=2 Tax=Saccharopolyspora erythraea TaxID=1836 RepID=A4FQS9_SACEN|nr:SDR family oxidoreductase [Saccharopolyspora erythraea]EQD87718.1 short-chain dehydrogenase [Saccharopolyspora erythraea D]PFG93006.1 NADP-dependent 3-hydroxy acid dehydrogenase YdfG [Saccharopolyspora erythraea NRRL 2338]QRK89895.1 SDR family oxidoreductase [Saccharopolyspora erythraea]CAM06404.1 short-chain dehydrogenase/reductase SDR [Saccharopolyspora erythraea NRRL 2338]